MKLKRIQSILDFVGNTYHVDVLTMLDIDRDRIAFYDTDGLFHSRSLLSLYQEMLDKRN